MRRLSLILVVVGLVATVIGTAAGCGALFSFNGRHAIAVRPLTLGTPTHGAFPAKAGRRYTLAVHVVFEREGLAASNGSLVVEAALPIVASLEDPPGNAVAKVIGFIDPNEAPTVLYGHVSDANQRRPIGLGPSELVAERLVGPYSSPGDRDLSYVVDLGAERTGKARVKEARIALYDDALPTSMTIGFAVAGVGIAMLASGLLLLFLGLFRARPASRGKQAAT